MNLTDSKVQQKEFTDSKAQMYNLNQNSQKLTPYAESAGVPKMPEGVTVMASANGFSEYITGFVGSRPNSKEFFIDPIMVALIGASSTLNAIRYGALVANSDDAMSISVISQESRQVEKALFAKMTDQTKEFLKKRKKSWNSIHMDRYIVEAVWMPEYYRYNILTDDNNKVITVINHVPGEPVRQIKRRMAQAWFDETHRALPKVPIAPHRSPHADHPWAMPLFNHFLVQGKIEFLPSMGVVATAFTADIDEMRKAITSMVEEEMLSDIREYVTFCDPGALD